MRRALPVLPLASLLVAASLGVAPSSAEAASTVPLPHDDPFYTYSGTTPLADVAPGTVLNERPIQLGDFQQGGSIPVQAEQLLYRTQDEQGNPSVTVTTVVAPTGQARGVVAYLSFYDALGDSCDPSYTLRGGIPTDPSNSQNAQVEEGLVLSLAAQGYAVTVPDFEGEDLHWVAGHESGWSTLDSVRAAESYLGMDASIPAGLMGYSGGSIGGEWAAELAPTYAPELNFVGAALGGIPVFLAHNLKYVNGSPVWSGVIPAVLVSLGRAFGIPMKHYESAYGRKITHHVADQCIGSFLGAYPGLKVQKLMKHKYRHFLKVPAFRKVVNSLIMGSAPGHPDMPLFLGVGNADGTGDNIMVDGDVEALGHEYCQQGVTVQYTEYQNSDHTQAGEQFFVDAESFLAQRFAGVPFAGNCSSIGPGNSLKPLKKRH